MKEGDDFVGILLAAGRSRRFGGDKLLHPLSDGTPLALASANALHAVLPRTVAVVRPGNKALIELFAAHGIETVIAEHADSGMGASLAAGIAATAKASGWLIALADMPAVPVAAIAGVRDALLAGAAIAAPSNGGRRGHPVGFSSRYRAELLALEGDAGARRLLERDGSGVVEITIDSDGIFADIDFPGDLKYL